MTMSKLIEMEKKFGHILDSAIERNSSLEDVFEEMQPYRNLLPTDKYFYENIEAIWNKYQYQYWLNAQGYTEEERKDNNE